MMIHDGWMFGMYDQSINQSACAAEVYTLP